MRCKPPDSSFFRDLRDLNTAFLGLIAGSGRELASPVLGLDPGVAGAIRGLSDGEIDYIASAPCPLAHFAGQALRVADSAATASLNDDRWRAAVQTFATEMAMFLWQVSRREVLFASLCLGPTGRQAQPFGSMSFGDIRAYADSAGDRLEARLARHPHFWPRLIRAARANEPEYPPIDRIAVIPLLLTERFAGDIV